MKHSKEGKSGYFDMEREDESVKLKKYLQMIEERGNERVSVVSEGITRRKNE